MIKINKVVLIGRLTKDVDIKTLTNTSVAKFTLAVNRPFKKDETDFINCVAFGKQAEIIAQYVTKGRQFAVAGRIQTGSYDAQDGTKRYTTDVVVESFDFIDSSNGTNNNSNNNDAKYDDMEPIDEGDIPF